VLIGLIKHCVEHKSFEDLIKVKQAYETLFKLIENEENNLKLKGLDPIDYLPLPVYACNNQEEHYNKQEKRLKGIL
jgi:hypothetical protein